MNTIMDEAIKKVGSQKKMAESLSVGQQIVSKWRRGVSMPSAKNVRKIEKLTGIPREKIRPDIFGEI